MKKIIELYYKTFITKYLYCNLTNILRIMAIIKNKTYL